MRPKHEGPPTGNVGFRFVSFRAVRDVSCVRRRARDRSIARALLGGLISVSNVKNNNEGECSMHVKCILNAC